MADDNRYDAIRKRHEVQAGKLGMDVDNVTRGQPPPPVRRSPLGMYLLVIAILALVAGTAVLLFHGRDAEPDKSPETDAPAGDAVGGEKAVQAKWLVMVYVDGDNNLDPFAMQNLADMESAGSSDKVKIAVLLDRAAGKEWSTARRFLVVKPAAGGKHSWDPSLKTCQDIGEANMGDPATLSAFVDWATRNYPAEKKMLVLWNHGGGWREVVAEAVKAAAAAGGTKDAVVADAAVSMLERGICWDDSNGGDFLETREIRQALESKGKFSIIGCDACLMGMVEVAYEWRNLADFFVASEELEPGPGWPWAAVLKGLRANPDQAAETLGAGIVTQFGAYYENRNQVTLSAIRLSKVEGVAKSLDTVSRLLIRKIKESGKQEQVSLHRPEIAGYPHNSPQFVDVESLMQSWEAADGLGEDWVKAVKDVRTMRAGCVVANYSHPELGGRGLSIFPGGRDMQFYNRNVVLFAKDTRWDEMLNL
ncbi:MAG: hypothetical protein C0404_01520, partial [Verrucomicrobia bacterium]|nr:hypothetical protein [Verrucomicrobiota bacterium]